MCPDNINNSVETLNPLEVVIIQMDIIWKNKQVNLRKVQELIEKAKPLPQSLVVLPEMFSTGFCMETEEIAEAEGGYIEQAIAELSRKYKVCIIAGIALKIGNNKASNMAVVFSQDGKVLSRYAKLHPFSPSGENEHYEKGNDVVVFDYQGWKIAPFICYDLRFPEIFRRAAMRGAEIITVIANWPAERTAHWLPLLQARAIENLCYVVGVNRVGSSPKHNYAGFSAVFNPWGELFCKAESSEQVLKTSLSKEQLRSIREKFPALNDARKEFLPD